MRRIALTVMVAALSAAGVALSPTASAATSCTGVMTNSVNGPVTVPAGVTCQIVVGTIHGSVTVQPGGRLVVGSYGPEVKGNIFADRPGVDTTSDPLGLGANRYDFSVIVCNTHVVGSVTVSHAPANVVVGDTEDGTCGGNRLDSSVNLNGNTGGVELINAQGSPCPISASYGPCRIAGSVNVNNNSGKTHDDLGEAAEVEFNKIDGSLNCKGNAGIGHSGNSVGGVSTGQCGN